jgi:hypothetical protein
MLGIWTYDREPGRESEGREKEARGSEVKIGSSAQQRSQVAGGWSWTNEAEAEAEADRSQWRCARKRSSSSMRHPARPHA